MASISPKKEYALEISRFNGGANLSLPQNSLKANESPDMKNLLWLGGLLRARYGQRIVMNTIMGTFYACYKKLWHGYVFAHYGTAVYCFDPNALSVTPQILCSAVPLYKGTFFAYGDKLYYKTRGLYKEFTATETATGWSFSAATVLGYTPVIQINTDPHNGSGDLYQPENRVSSKKEVQYNAVANWKDYFLPVRADYIYAVYVDGVQLLSGWSYDPYAGKVIFQTAPPVTDPPTNNTVRIIYSLTNTQAQLSIDRCRVAEVYGGTGELCVIMSGNEDQPNAYYWSGNSNLKMDPTYFPIEQVQLAGNNDEAVTGFGKQQSNLIVFKERSIGKTAIGTQEINGRIYVDMPYTPINPNVGCDYPDSIQLVENNLVFANSRNGVYMLLDTTEANENNIIPISRKVNKLFIGALTGTNKELVGSFDDGKYYWLSFPEDGFCLCWDYADSNYSNPAWFPQDGIYATSFVDASPWEGGNGAVFYNINNGRFCCFIDERKDYGNAFTKLYKTPVLNFGSGDCRKNVNSILAEMDAQQEGHAELTYTTEYGSRSEPTDLDVTADYEPDREPGERPVTGHFPAFFRRRPMARRITSFQVTFSNSTVKDMPLVSLQIFYNIQGRLR